MIDWIKKTAAEHLQSVTGSYKFYLKAEPQYVETSTTITITAFTDKTESALVPCHYRWFKLRNGLKEENLKFKGSSYVCEPSDMGAIIEAEIISNDQEYSGKAIVSFGPVRINYDLRRQVENTLINGSTIINAALCQGSSQKQCQFKIFEDMIKICHLYSEINYSFDYCIYEPRIEAVPRDALRLQIKFGERYESGIKTFTRNLFAGSDTFESDKSSQQTKLEIKFQSKFVKDLFLLTLKAFFTKKEIKNSVVIHRIEQFSSKDQEKFDYLFEIQSLKTDLAKVAAANQQNQTELLRYKSDVGRMQKEFEQIIMTYTKIVEDKCKNEREFNQSCSLLTTKREEIVNRKYKNLEHQNLGLNERIKMLSAEIDEIRFNSSFVKNNQTNFHQSDFTKKAMGQQESVGCGHQDTQFIRMLDQLEVSQVQQVPDDILNVKKRLDDMTEEKRKLQVKLEMSFQKIDRLQKQANTKNHHSAINFSYSSANNGNSRLNLTSPYEDTEKYEKLKRKVEELERQNLSLVNENKSLQSQLSMSASKIIIKNLDTSKYSMNIRDANQSSNEGRFKGQIDTLNKQIRNLKDKLSAEVSLRQQAVQEKLQAHKQNQQLKKQISMYKRNQDVLNRSQTLTLEMDQYNEQQLSLLKRHNEFLTTENEKLTVACEKYMKEGRENTKLRKQVIELKEKLMKKILNPETSELSVQS